MHQAIEPRPLGSRFGNCLAHDNERARQDFEVIAVTTKFFHPPLNVGIERAPIRETAPRAENHLGSFGGKLATRF